MQIGFWGGGEFIWKSNFFKALAKKTDDIKKEINDCVQKKTNRSNLRLTMFLTVQ